MIVPIACSSGRMRSSSLSVVEGSPQSSARAPSRQGPKTRRLLLKQLLNMDKKSLQELVDDPRSRKVRRNISLYSRSDSE